MSGLRIADITDSLMNENVEMEGEIVTAWDLTKGKKLIVADPSGQIPVILWDNVLAEINQVSQLRVGARVRVSGRVGAYKDELRVVPARADDVILLAQVNDRERKAVPLSRLPAVGAGRSVWVTGTITAMETFSKGVKLHISDGEGSAIVLLWQNIYDSLLVQDELIIETCIGIYGEINHYQDTWEIVPRSRDEIVVLSSIGD